MTFNPLDGTVIGLLVAFIIYGALKGSVKPIISLVSWGSAIALIYLFSAQLGEVLMSTSMGDWISGMLSGVTEGLGDTFDKEIILKDGVWIIAGTATTVESVLQGSLVVPGFMISSIMSSLAPGALSASVTTALVSSIGQVTAALMIALATGTVFFLFKVLVCRSIKGKRMGALNRTFGSLLYLIMGAFFIFFSFILLDFIVGFFDTEIANQIKDMLNNGMLTQYITKYNPITMLIGVM